MRVQAHGPSACSAAWSSRRSSPRRRQQRHLQQRQWRSWTTKMRPSRSKVRDAAVPRQMYVSHEKECNCRCPAACSVAT